MVVPKMLTLKETSELTGLSYGGLRHMCINNEIVHVRVGRKYFINAEKLTEYLNGKGQVIKKV